MKIILIVLFLAFSVNAYAVERYAIDNPDGSLTIAYYIPGSNDSLEEFLYSVGLSGLPITKITEMPEDKKDRSAWKRNGSRIVVDPIKKQSESEAKAQKQAKQDLILAKLKITKADLKEFNR